MVFRMEVVKLGEENIRCSYFVVFKRELLWLIGLSLFFVIIFGRFKIKVGKIYGNMFNLRFMNIKNVDV